MEAMDYKPSRSSFLALPLEIRIQVYRYLVPTTYFQENTYRFAKPSDWIMKYFWILGSTSILRVNHQIYDEAIICLYENATFTIKVFSFQSFFLVRLGPNLCYCQGYEIPQRFSSRHIRRIRRLDIHINGRNGDPSTIKELIREVALLCSLLQTIPRIKSLRIWYNAEKGCLPYAQAILKPFLPLSGVENIEVGGLVDAGTKSEMESALRRNRSRGMIDLNRLSNRHANTAI